MLTNILAALAPHEPLLVFAALLVAMHFFHLRSVAAVKVALEAAMPPSDRALAQAADALLDPPAPIVVVTAPALPLLMMALALLGCSAAQTKAVITDVERGLQDGEKICVEAEVLLGVAEPKAVALACAIDATAEKALEAEIDLEAAAVAQMVSKSLGKPGARAVCRQ